MEHKLAIDSKPWREATEEPFIQIRNISKNFGDVKAVEEVNLDIYKSELFCLLGGSGSGKSTLLRMLAGFESPTHGSIEIDGQDMVDVPAYARPTNMMFQSYALFPHMSVEKNIGYGLARDGVAKTEINQRVGEMLTMVQLEELGKRKPHQLSGGQRQRVALARSLVKRPKVLLLDEPLGALDKKLREETQFELIQLQETLGVTFIVVTHDQEEAMTLATRIGVMDHGRIVQVGEPTEIYEYPATRFVADFIGSVNLFEGRVIEDEADHVLIQSDDADCQIYVSHGVSCSPNQTLWFAIRPEKLEISKRKPKGKYNITRGSVEDIAYLGSLSVFRIRLENGKIIKMTRANRTRNEEDSITWEDVVYISWQDNSGVVLTQ